MNVVRSKTGQEVKDTWPFVRRRGRTGPTGRAPPAPRGVRSHLGCGSAGRRARSLALVHPLRVRGVPPPPARAVWRSRRPVSLRATGSSPPRSARGPRRRSARVLCFSFSLPLSLPGRVASRPGAALLPEVPVPARPRRVPEGSRVRSLLGSRVASSVSPGRSADAVLLGHGGF